jgi:hypothetical protein
MQHACIQGSSAEAPSSTYVRVDSGVREGDEVSERHGDVHSLRLSLTQGSYLGELQIIPLLPA